jgi:hypothetical protein
MHVALSPETQEFVNCAERIYNAAFKTRLEAESFGSLIASEPESGDYVLGSTFRGIDVAAQKWFGNRPVHIFRIGGGGAVKVGGVGRDARIS